MIQSDIGWYQKSPDITQLMASAIRGHLDAKTPDAVLNIETHLFNTILTAESADFKLDVGKELWLNKGRWSRLIREYVPKSALNLFIDQAVEIISREARDGATAIMHFKDPERFDKKHRWGGCLCGATFRGNNHKAGRATLTFYSRTTYMGYMALLDAAIANRIANAIITKYAGSYLYDRRPMSIKDISFRWHLSSQQLHCFKTLPYIYSQPDLMEQLDRMRRQRRMPPSSPTWFHILKWYNKVHEAWDTYKDCSKMLAAEKYGPFKRIKRRWLEHMGYSTKNVPPSLMVDELDFTKADDTSAQVDETDFDYEQGTDGTMREPTLDDVGEIPDIF